MSKLVIVESPTKAKKLKGWLPKEYVIESSVGHIRDLPPNDRQVPDRYKDNKGLKHGILMGDGFEAVYVPTERGKKVISDLKKKMASADIVYLATDPDREGESISWHLKDALKPKVPVKRVTFNEVTKKAVEAAFANPRDIDEGLVNAQETRRILDRLVGYELSPLLWRKIATGLSAGRVQSVAVRLLVERERERMRFKSAAYWDLQATLRQQEQAFEASLFQLGGKDVVTSANAKKHFDETTGALRAGADVVVLNEQSAKTLEVRVRAQTWTVTDVQERRGTSRPYEPFITDTLVQAAGNRLNLSARDTMRVAQELYENGWITYHRTDSPTLSEEGMAATRAAVQDRYGAEYLYPSPRTYTGKQSANAQEAHEAIRPAGEQFVAPDRTGLKARQLGLYTEIYKRTLASQMKDEEYTSTTVLIEVADALFKATGKRVDFAGWRKAYGYDGDSDRLLPALSSGDNPTLVQVEAQGHETKPPARYTEGSLIKALKEDGVGRPSTYAQIMETIQNKEYAVLQGKALVPTFTAFAVTQLLENHFPDLVDEKFTARMEATLDEIAAGTTGWQDYLREFYKGDNGLEAQVAGHTNEIDPRTASMIHLPQLDGTGIVVKVGKFGPYLERHVGEDRFTANVPNDVAPADLDPERVERLLQQAAEGPEALGSDPATGEKVYLLDGRFGPYVQLGEVEDKKKPPRQSIPKDWDPTKVSLEDALFLLRLPREIGAHPDGGRVIASIGRYGPYVCHENDAGDRDFRSLKDVAHLRGIALDEALELLKQPKAGRGRTRAPAKVLADLGVHPDDGAPVQVLDGRYGPYVKHGKTNATLPKDTDPKSVGLDQALALVAEKAAKGKGGRKRAAKKSTKKVAKKAGKKSSKTATKKAAGKRDD